MHRSDPMRVSVHPSSSASSVSAASRPRLQLPSPRSRIFQRVLQQVLKFARHDSITIVFEGETGTGKNWLARLAHRQSPRSERAFHTISVAAFNDSLIGSELFGHEPGAFTDARVKRLGAFQSAHQGTLFIDELGKASIAVQQHLLRVIDEGTLTPVGADRPVRVDVRMLAATNVSLRSLIDEKIFLHDLYPRLGLFTILVPPLRDRREDIQDLAEYFVATHAVALGCSPGLPTIHPALMESLQLADWEFNVRGLESTMKRLIVEAESAPQLTFEHCGGGLEFLCQRGRRPARSSPEKVATTVQRSRSKAAAARELDISRSTLYRRLGRAGGNPPDGSVAK